MVVLIVGSRFGGKAVPEALSAVDIDSISNNGFDVSAIDNITSLSVTQLEVLKALEAQLPVFAFVDEKVWHDHHVYEKNSDIVAQIKFPSIDKQETSIYIFEFINFLKSRIRGNSVISFSKVEDIESHLRKQWASLFQRLLKEDRDRSYDDRRAFGLSEQIEDLKTAVLSTISNTQARDIARGTIKYRRLVEFLNCLLIGDVSAIYKTTVSFDDLLKEAGVANVVELEERELGRPFGKTILIKDDGTYFELRYARELLTRISTDWDSFIAMSEENRKVIHEALSDLGGMGPPMVRYRATQFEQSTPDGSEAFQADAEDIEKG
jgi:hypothetical protein